MPAWTRCRVFKLLRVIFIFISLSLFLYLWFKATVTQGMCTYGSTCLMHGRSGVRLHGDWVFIFLCSCIWSIHVDGHGPILPILFSDKCVILKLKKFTVSGTTNFMLIFGAMRCIYYTRNGTADIRYRMVFGITGLWTEWYNYILWTLCAAKSSGPMGVWQKYNDIWDHTFLKPWSTNSLTPKKAMLKKPCTDNSIQPGHVVFVLFLPPPLFCPYLLYNLGKHQKEMELGFIFLQPTYLNLWAPHP